jgi:colanic acid/amylovoran biosynthesis glycosyltransferase
MSTKVAYFINQYPQVSHAFIRREILALERQGVDVLRLALRGWDSRTVDPEDEDERKRTQYVLRDGLIGLAIALLRSFVTSPLRFTSALMLAIKMGLRGERALPYHLAYLAEACVIVPWIHRFNATHVHAHFGTNSAEIVMLARALGGPPYSFTVHGPTEFDRPVALSIREKIFRSAFVVAITSFGRSQLYRWISHAHWHKIKVVHCGLESEYFLGKPSPPPTARRLVCLGRLVEQKGQLLLIEAAALLAKNDINFELVLIGDGPMRGEIETLISQRSLSKQIRLTGSISTEKLREEMLASRGLVLPSFAEGLPMVIMESMALRRPVLTTYVAGNPELIRHGIDGLLFPAGSVEALADAMEDFLSRPVEELQKMGEAAYARVVERHSIDVEATKLAALFREVST